jgi:hypothetical protein
MRPTVFSRVSCSYLNSDLKLYQFLKFSLFQGYRIYHFTFLTLTFLTLGTKVSNISKSMGSKEIRFTALLTRISYHKWKYPERTLSMTLTPANYLLLPMPFSKFKISILVCLTLIYTHYTIQKR